MSSIPIQCVSWLPACNSGCVGLTGFNGLSFFLPVKWLFWFFPLSTQSFSFFTCEVIVWFVFSSSVSTRSLSCFYLRSDLGFFGVFFPESVASPSHFFTREMMGGVGGGFQSVPSPFHFLQVKWFFFSLSRVRTQSLSFCLPVKWLFFQSRYPVPFIFNLWSGFFLLSPEPVPSPLDSDNEDVAADNYGTSRQLDKNVLNNNNNNSYGTLPL